MQEEKRYSMKIRGIEGEKRGGKKCSKVILNLKYAIFTIFNEDILFY